MSPKLWSLKMKRKTESATDVDYVGDDGGDGDDCGCVEKRKAGTKFE